MKKKAPGFNFLIFALGFMALMYFTNPTKQNLRDLMKMQNKLPTTIAVSYTHLDVYKRQILTTNTRCNIAISDTFYFKVMKATKLCDLFKCKGGIID